MCKIMISPVIFFFFFKKKGFWAARGVKGQKIAQNKKIITSVPQHISGTVQHKIMISGTLV